uniref:UN4 n=1 Tax=Kamese virus TaxID=200402 RepID=A0A1V0QSV6_9RHAB|nr:UN4 [Kamese virus]
MNLAINLSMSFKLQENWYTKEVIDRLEWEIVSWMRDNHRLSTEVAAIVTTFLISQMSPLYLDGGEYYMTSELRVNLSFMRRSRHTQYPGTTWILENPLFSLAGKIIKVCFAGRITYPGGPGGQTPWETWYTSVRSKIPRELRREIEDAAHSYNFEYLLEY